MPYKLGIVGNPVKQSLSPLIHHQFAKQFGIDLSYQKYLTAEKNFQQTVLDFFKEGGLGLNITMPFKQHAFEIAKKAMNNASLAQSVNTLKINKQGILIGENTDGIGLIKDMRQNLSLEIKGKTILLLGAGGAARGIIGPLLKEKCNIWLNNRTKEKAVLLQNYFNSSGNINLYSPHESSHIHFDMIINCCSQQLAISDFNVPSFVFKTKPFCYDLNYGSELVFIEWVKQYGIKEVANGLGMLIEQAAASFFLWFDVYPQTKPVLDYLKVNL
jgi:shikimate dehydrogenase